MSSINSSVMSAGLLALGLAAPALSGCGDASDEYGPGGIPPLDGVDASLPRTPRNEFERCYPPNEALGFALDGQGAVPPGGRSVNGGSFLAVDRASLRFPGDSGYVDYRGGTDGGVRDAGRSQPNPRRFRADLWWASMPPEFFTGNPADPGYGLMAQRTQARLSGAPLSELRRSGTTSSWGDVYPPYARSLGLGGVVVGEFVPGPSGGCSDSRLSVTIYGAVRTAGGGMSGPLNQVAVAFYAGGTRLAPPDYGDREAVVVLPPINASLRYTTPNDAGDVQYGPTATVCNGGCVTGGGALERLQVRVVRGRFSRGAVTPDAGRPDARVDAAVVDVPDARRRDVSGEGIAPLPSPDTGVGDGGRG